MAQREPRTICSPTLRNRELNLPGLASEFYQELREGQGLASRASLSVYSSRAEWETIRRAAAAALCQDPFAPLSIVGRPSPSMDVETHDSAATARSTRSWVKLRAPVVIPHTIPRRASPGNDVPVLPQVGFASDQCHLANAHLRHLVHDIQTALGAEFITRALPAREPQCLRGSHFR